MFIFFPDSINRTKWMKKLVISCHLSLFSENKSLNYSGFVVLPLLYDRKSFSRIKIRQLIYILVLGFSSSFLLDFVCPSIRKRRWQNIFPLLGLSKKKLPILIFFYEPMLKSVHIFAAITLVAPSFF